MLSWLGHLRPQKIYWTLPISQSNVTGLEMFLSRINNFTVTPSTQEYNGKSYSHNCKETRMTTNSTQRYTGKDYSPNLKVGMNPPPKLANYFRLHSSVTGQTAFNSRFHQLQPCNRHLTVYILLFIQCICDHNRANVGMSQIYVAQNNFLILPFP